MSGWLGGWGWMIEWLDDLVGFGWIWLVGWFGSGSGFCSCPENIE
jgi:hypothetical protein